MIEKEGIRRVKLLACLAIVALASLAMTAQPAGLSRDERVVKFVKLWSEVKYNFAFFDKVPDLDWDKVFVEYLPKVEAAEDDYEYLRVLQRCVALLHDGHTGVWGPVEGPPMGSPAVGVEAVGGKAIITAVADTPENKAAGIARGDEIVSVDGRPAKDVLAEEVFPYIPSSTSQWRDLKAYPRLLVGPVGSQVTVVFKSLDGQERNATLPRTSHAPVRRLRPRYDFFRETPDGFACVSLASFESDSVVREFDKAFGKVRQSKGLIIDVRGNGGGSGSIGYAIVSRLIDKPLAKPRWKTRQYMPTLRVWGERERWYEGAGDEIQPSGEGAPFLGPVVVLTDAAVFSAAEDFLVPLHASRRATLVGERTGGSTGQPLKIDLGDGWGARVCTRWDTYPDGREFVGVGIIPNVEVHPTVEDVISGRDVVFERGVEVLKGLAVDSSGAK